MQLHCFADWAIKPEGSLGYIPLEIIYAKKKVISFIIIIRVVYLPHDTQTYKGGKNNNYKEIKVLKILTSTLIQKKVRSQPGS